MTNLVAFGVIGLVTGAAYAIAASGLVLTYATSNVFNVAHGAIGMVMAFLYWELSINQGLPTAVSLLLVVGVAAPLLGFLIDRAFMRRLADAPVAVSLVITVALMVLLVGLAQMIWPPTARRAPEFLPGTSMEIGTVVVSGHEALTFVLAAVVAAGLYLLLGRTRTGIAMRAVVDDRGLVALHGARPARLSALSWGLGSALAALAGILIVSTVGLDYLTLTLLVVNAYAAAMVGRLKNLPRTFVGAMILGLLQAYFLLAMGYLPFDLSLGGLRAALPALFLFVVMLLLPQERLRVGAVTGTSLVRLPSRRRALVCGAALLVGVYVVSGLLSAGNVSRLGQALALSVIMLSLVLLTGYGGEVSLGQMTFVGVGALVVAQVFGGVTLLSVLAAGLVAAFVGALVALPALRLRGLYLALGTLAFASAMDKLVFESRSIGFSLGGASLIERPGMLSSERAFALATAVGFVALALVVLELRRGRFGRLLLAMRDSEAACGTLGLSITRTRVTVFALSAAMAGVGGALYGGMQVSVGPPDFNMFQSLPLLLLAVVGGITSVTGALIGGLVLGGLPPQYVFVTAGAVALTLGRNPNGLAGWLFGLGRSLQARLAPGPAPAPAEAPAPVERVEERIGEEVGAHGAT